MMFVRSLLVAAAALSPFVGASYTQPETSLRVRVGDRAKQLPLVRQPDGSFSVRADLLADAIDARLVTAQEGKRYQLQVDAARIELVPGTGFAIAGADTVPLRASIYRSDGRIFLPLAFVTDALPRLATGVIFDDERRELRRFGSVSVTRAAPLPTTPTRNASTSASSSPRVTGAAAAAAARGRVVVVDAGHGGPDNGMSGPIGVPRKVYEKNITLAVARQLRVALEKRGVRVVMTRTTDTLIALSDRGRIANEAKGDLFMSVHVNAANPRWQNPGAARGFETYFLAEAKTEDERRVAAMENEAIKFETTVDASRDDPLGFIIRDMAQNEHLRESARLAELVQGGLARMHPGPNRGVKQAGFRVLVTAFMPAVLVELGFGSNRSESAFMSDPEKQREIAETLADAAVAYLAEYERKVGSGT